MKGGDEFDIIYKELTDFSFENTIDQSELLSLIHDYLRKKQPVVRKIFYLYYSLDLKIFEIAKELHLSESNVKNKLYRTLLELRNKFNL